MKVSDVIRQADALRPNTLTAERKASWVEDLDAEVEKMMRDVRGVGEAVKNYYSGLYNKRLLSCLVKDGVLDRADYAAITHDAELVPAEREGRYPAEDWELLLQTPHAETYVLYLVSKIDFYNQETDLYANDKAMFDAAWAQAQAAWRRDNRPKSVNGWVV